MPGRFVAHSPPVLEHVVVSEAPAGYDDRDEVRLGGVLWLPCALPRLKSMAVRFAAGARTVPHVHHGGQHLVFVEGSGVVGDDDGVHVVHTGDVVSSPAGGWHWHGALLKVDRQRIGVGSGLARRARLVAGTGLLVGGEEVVMLPAGG